MYKRYTARVKKYATHDVPKSNERSLRLVVDLEKFTSRVLLSAITALRNWTTRISVNEFFCQEACTRSMIVVRPEHAYELTKPFCISGV